jgi:hypothetical protein
MIINVKYPISEYRVPSRSNLGTYHYVTIFNDGRVSCDCPQGLYKGNCWHKDIVNKVLKLKEAK